jgi:ABC transporter substrate binding protein (PQQ-dependent alcohol dehydrogenase system)
MAPWNRKLSRRRLLALGGGALATGWLGRAWAQAESEPQVIRIGMVLPTQTGTTPVRAAAYQVAADAARAGAIMAEEELGFNAELVGKRLEVLIATAPDTESAVRAAQRLISVNDVFAIVGGYGDETALALSQLAAEQQVPFFNIGSASDALRGALCNPYTFHVEASAAMYLDALTAWYVRAGFRRWFYVYPDSDEGRALYERALFSLNERHFGAEEVGSAVVDPNNLDFTDTLNAIQDSDAEVVLLLTDAVAQLSFLGEYDNAGLAPEVTGFPYPTTQTRTFLAASRNGAPDSGTGYRASLWEANIDAYGARELNVRFRERWGMPMDGPAWAAYMSVKMLYEAAAFGGGVEADKVLAYLENPATNFDVYKGIGVSFRPWDHQLRQSLYLIKINPDADNALNLADLVGELPALYLPGTDPLERLDQLGDLERASPCNF